MVSEINPAPALGPLVNGTSWSAEGKEDKAFDGSISQASPQNDIASSAQETAITRSELVDSASSLGEIVNSVSRTSISFTVEQDLSRLVVAVRAVGSDEIIRQFPPEEFITVAKFIAAQNPEMIDEDYLKGILFDQYT